MQALVANAIGEPLTTLTPSGGLRGGLAETWTADAEGRLWSFELQRDRAFQDGTPLTAQTVVESLSVHCCLGGALETVDRLVAIDAMTVGVELAVPDAHLPLRLADPRLAILKGETGSGAYRIASGSLDEGYRLERAGQGPELRANAWFDGIEILRVARPEARRDALLSARVDIALDLPREAATALARHRRLSSLTVPVLNPLGVIAKPDAQEDAVRLLDLMTNDENHTGLQVPGHVTVSLSPDAAEASGAAPLLRRLVTAADRCDIHLEPVASDGELCISAGTGSSTADTMLVGHSVDLNYITPPDAGRIPERWFFT